MAGAGKPDFRHASLQSDHHGLITVGTLQP